MSNNYESGVLDLAPLRELQLGRYLEARYLYDHALKLDPSLGNAHLNIGNIAFRWGNWTEAIFRYER